MKNYIFALAILSLSGCASNALKQNSGLLLNLSLAENSTETHNIKLFMKSDFISGYAIPDDLKEELNGSLRWKWYAAEHAPNACYIIDNGLDHEGNKNIDVGLAILDYDGSSIFGPLLKWPDAGLKVKLVISGAKEVTGYSEWWGGPIILVEDENGEYVKDESNKQDNKKQLIGTATEYSSINECFEIIKTVNI